MSSDRAAAPPSPTAVQTANVPYETPGPDRLRIQFMEPRLLEIQWDPQGMDDQYRVYAAAGPDFKDATPLLDRTLQATHMAWRVDEGVREVWFAVKAIHPTGQETDYGSPAQSPIANLGVIGFFISAQILAFENIQKDRQQ